jgi:hypothetical protein
MRRYFLVAALGLAACSSSSNAPDGAAHPDGADAAADAGAGDGGDDGAGAFPVDGGFVAFEITATIDELTADPSQGGGWDAFPKTFKLTVAWDASGSGYSGGGAVSSPIGITRGDAGSGYSSQGPWMTSAPFDAACDKTGSLMLDQVNFFIENGALRGTGQGHASYKSGQDTLEASAHVAFVGAPDVSPPTFTATSTSADDPFDPIAGLRFVASEPLPDGDKASLVGTPSGDVVPLRAVHYGGALVTAVGAFDTPNVALRYGETYRLVTSDLPDFVGNVPTAPVSVKTRDAPPLVPEDGFESVTGTMFGGAGVLRGGPLTPINGATSMLLNTGFGGGFGFLPYDLGPSLAVRLAVAPGATVVRFAAELIAPDPVDQAFFDGWIHVGSEGRSVTSSQSVVGMGFVKQSLLGLGDIFVSPVQTIEIRLPPDTTDEITFEIVGVTFACGLPPSPTVLVVDDLRVE